MDGNLSILQTVRKCSLLTSQRGGVGEDKCAILVNAESVRVFFKNNYSFGVAIFNAYMVTLSVRNKEDRG